MKYSLIILIMSVFIFSACSGQKVVSAPDKPIMLATSDMECVKTAERRDWYIFWGLTPVSNEVPTVAPILTGVNKPVKIEITTTFTDAMLSIFTIWGSFIPETTIVYECEKK